MFKKKYKIINFSEGNIFTIQILSLIPFLSKNFTINFSIQIGIYNIIIILFSSIFIFFYKCIKIEYKILTLLIIISTIISCLNMIIYMYGYNIYTIIDNSYFIVVNYLLILFINREEYKKNFFVFLKNRLCIGIQILILLLIISIMHTLFLIKEFFYIKHYLLETDLKNIFFNIFFIVLKPDFQIFPYSNFLILGIVISIQQFFIKNKYSKNSIFI